MADDAYRRLLNNFDFRKACLEWWRFHLERDIRDARLGNRPPELFQKILGAVELLQKAEMGMPEIEGMLLARGVEIGEIAVQ